MSTKIIIQKTSCPNGTASNSDASFTLSVPSGGTAPIPDSQINVNGNNEGDVVSVQPIDVNLTDGTNPVNPDSVTLVGNNLTIEVPDCDVENSDASYTASVESGGVLVLPDSDVNVNGNFEGDVVSVQPIDINVTDGTNPVTPTAIGISGNTVTIEVPAGGGGAPVGATLMRTGQTTSYRTGDDADTRAEGRATDFFTLASNNPFGNTNRFTDELGGQTYTNNIVIDWSTYDGTTVLGWRRTTNGVNIAWANAIDGALLVSIGTFTSGWRLPNITELNSFANHELGGLRHSVFSPIGLVTLWSSTTSKFVSTGSAITVTSNTLNQAFTTKTTTTSMRYIPCRTFTVTGTTLS
jgi:hypothetical protein